MQRADLLTPWRVRAALITLGTGLIGLTAFEIHLWWVVRSVIEISFVAGILMSLPAAGLLVAGGYWLPRTAVPGRYYPRLLMWTVAGIVVFGGFSVITGVTFFPELFWAQVGSIRWGVSVGGCSGFLIGFLIARGIERRVAIERAAVRTEEAEERREILEFLNALLRHEVLNKVQVIKGQTNILESELDDGASKQQHTKIIKRHSDDMAGIIRDVQFLLETSDEDATLEPLDLRPILETELQNTDDRHEMVETELNAPPEIPVMANDLIRRAFSNLLENAVKHNDSAPKRVSISVTLGAETVTVEIADNGPGIPEDDIEGLFDPVVKQKATHGLGLTIVARLIDRYGGDIELAETGSDGTVFAMTLSSPPGDAATSLQDV